MSKAGHIESPLSDLDDLFFEVIYPEDARFTYRTRMAKEFGSSFVGFKFTSDIILEVYYIF